MTSGDGTLWGTINPAHNIRFAIGWEDAKENFYKITYYNSRYGIESLQSDEFSFNKPISSRLVREVSNNFVDNEVFGFGDPVPVILPDDDAEVLNKTFYTNYTDIRGFPGSNNGSADKIRLYKKQVTDTGNANFIVNYSTTAEVEYSDNYFFVGEFDLDVAGVNTITDGTDSRLLVDELDSLVDEGEDITLSGRYRISRFKNRLVLTDGSDVYFSRTLEDLSHRGRTGDPIYESFPELNRYEVRGLGDILGLASHAIGTDQGPQEVLVVYLENAVAILSGGNSPLNPPADLDFDVVLHNIGLIGNNAVTEAFGKHIFLSRSGVFGIDSSLSVTNLSNGYIKSILNDISDTNLAKSVLQVGREGYGC